MDVDAFEDRDLGFEVKLKELDNADDDFRAAERHSTWSKLFHCRSTCLTVFALQSELTDLIFCAVIDQVCKHFAKGKCTNFKCPDLHIKVKTTVCKHWLNSLCKKNRGCEFLHRYELSKMPVCHFWSDYRECNNGIDCVFMHIDEESTAEDCAAYTQGFCKNGPRCKERHRKKQVCERYLIGFCPEGPSCKFGHPKF